MAVSSIPPRQSAFAGALRRPLQPLRQGLGWFSTTQLEVTEKNARLLEFEVFWAAFLSAAATFNAAYAVRLGASNTEVGLLSSLPALLAFLVTIPAGRYFSRQAAWMPPILRSLFVYRFGFLVVAFLPWLPLPAKDGMLIWTIIAFTIPAHFFSVGWNSMMATAIPEVKRSKVFAMRNGLSAVAITGGIFVAGQWLEYAPFPLNYQIMYAVGFATSMVSLYYIAKLYLPLRAVAVAPSPKTPTLSLNARWIALRAAWQTHPDFVRMVINTFVHGLGLWMVAPLYVLYFVRELGASEGWLGLHGMLANLTPVLGYYLWQRVIERHGENWVLKLTIAVIGFYPLLVGVTLSPALILGGAALNGLLAAGINLSHFPMLLKVCPADNHPLYMGIYTTLMNLGAFIMPMIGVILADQFGLMPVLIAGGVLCFIGSVSFVFFPLRTADSLAVRQTQI